MTDAVNRFYSSIEDVDKIPQGRKIDFFVYFLTVELGRDSVTPMDVNKCFMDCDLESPVRTAAHLSEGLKSKPQKFLRVGSGYKLDRHYREGLAKQLGAQTMLAQTSATLRSLENHLPDGPSKEFLKEALDCIEVGANRAAVVLTWILTVDHLYSHILNYKLTEFNAVLAANRDRSVRIRSASIRDDFSEIREERFIELCREARIISNDVMKILKEKLGTRNSSAHPSGITIGKAKVIDFVEDLVTNVVLKYPI